MAPAEQRATRPRGVVPDRLVCGLARIVGDEHVLTDGDLLATYETDQTGRFTGHARAVVRPLDVAETSEVLRLCASFGAPVVVQGGNTGLSGGGVPQDDEVVLSMRRLDEVDFDASTEQLVAGAGATLEALHRAARSVELEFALDFPARGSATVGGMVATNAAGASALRWGPMRAQVRGMEVVLSTGAVLTRMNGLAKDNAGFDWPALVAGSEGTLAVVAGARLQLRRPPAQRLAALVGVPDLEAAVLMIADVRGDLGDVLEAADFMDGPSLELACRHRRMPIPLAHGDGPCVTLTLAGDHGLVERLDEALSRWPVDVVAAEDSLGRRRLWSYREAINEAIRTQGIVHKLDVSLPLARVAEFAAQAPARVAAIAPTAEVLLFGHLADGNLHVNVLGLPAGDDRADASLLELVADLGGSIDAEHGIGLAKRAYLGLTRSDEEISAMRAIKAALDPIGILNPGRVMAAQ